MAYPQSLAVEDLRPVGVVFEVRAVFRIVTALALIAGREHSPLLRVFDVGLSGAVARFAADGRQFPRLPRRDEPVAPAKAGHVACWQVASTSERVFWSEAQACAWPDVAHCLWSSA